VGGAEEPGNKKVVSFGHNKIDSVVDKAGRNDLRCRGKAPKGKLKNRVAKVCVGV